jgi:RNA polymerase sigma factor (sigma-70 family)
LEEGRVLRHDLALRRAYEQGEHEYGTLPVAYPLFARRYLSLTCRRLLASGVSTTDAKIAAALQRAAGADVYLTVACDENVAGAWEIFTSRFVPRLRGLARKRGARATEADDLANHLPSELAQAPANGETRTRIGRFDGSSSLFSWLTVICLRRLVDRRRARAVRPIPAGSVPDQPAPARQADPSRRIADAEAAHRFRTSLAAAWNELSPQESLALLWKHRDGLRQKQIAALLGVGTPRVSRIVKRAIEKLRDGVSRGEENSSWSALLRAVEKHMETLAAGSELPRGESIRDD